MLTLFISDILVYTICVKAYLPVSWDCRAYEGLQSIFSEKFAHGAFLHYIGSVTLINRLINIAPPLGTPRARHKTTISLFPVSVSRLQFSVADEK